MGTFLLESTNVNKKEKGFYFKDIQGEFGLIGKEKVFNGCESVTVGLVFVNNGDTSSFTEEDILVLLMEKLKEISKDSKYYTKKDLVDFGNYLLSDRRTKAIKAKENIKKVHDCDIDKFTAKQQNP